jgi:hypothetical protein
MAWLRADDVFAAADAEGDALKPPGGFPRTGNEAPEQAAAGSPGPRRSPALQLGTLSANASGNLGEGGSGSYYASVSCSSTCFHHRIGTITDADQNRAYDPPPSLPERGA